MAETIDDQIKANAPQEKKEEPKGILRSGLEEIVQGVGTAANLAVAGTLPWVVDRGIGNFKGLGGVDAMATSAAYYLGAADKSSRSARLESIVGTLFAAFAKLTFGPVAALGAYVKAALVPLWILGAVGTYMTIDKVVKRQPFKGFWKNYKEIAKKTIMYLGIPTYLTTFLPGLWQIPSIAFQGYIYRKFIVRDKEKAEPKDKTPYYVAASNMLSKLGSKLLSPLRALYEIGSGLYKPKQPIQPEPKPA